MHLLIVTDWSYPCDEPFMREVYAKRWQDAGHEVTWVMRQSDDDTTFGDWRGSDVYIAPDSFYGFSTVLQKGLFARSGWLSSIEKKVGPFDIIQVRNDIPAAYAACRLAKDKGVPFVFRHSHLKAETLCLGYREGVAGYGLTDYIKGLVGKYLRKPVLNRSDAVFAISDAMVQYHRSQGVTGSIFALPMGADTTVRPGDIDPDPFCEKYRVNEDEYLIYVGSMNPLRKLEFMFKSLSKLQKTHPEIQLVMIGGRDSKRRNYLRQSADEHGVSDDVRFTGWVTEERVRQGIRGAAVGLSPLPPNNVFTTNSPTKVLEYLNLGTPAIVTRTPEQVRMVEPEGGIVADYTPKAFAEAAANLIANPENRTRMGDSGRRQVEREWSYNNRFSQVLWLYERLLK